MFNEPQRFHGNLGQCVATFFAEGVSEDSQADNEGFVFHFSFQKPLPLSLKDRRIIPKGKYQVNQWTGGKREVARSEESPLRWQISGSPRAFAIASTSPFIMSV